MRTYVRVRAHVRTCMPCMRTCVRTHVRTYARTHVRTAKKAKEYVRTYVCGGGGLRKLIIPTRHPRQMATCARAYVRAHVRTCAVELTRVTYARTYVRTHLRTYVHLDVCARMPCMHTYASTRARTYAQRKRRKEMWRRRMTEAHHSHPPRNVRTYVRSYARTYVRTYVRTHVRTLGRLRAHAVHAYVCVRTHNEIGERRCGGGG